MREAARCLGLDTGAISQVCRRLDGMMQTGGYEFRHESPHEAECLADEVCKPILPEHVIEEDAIE
jgi:hypothetical protein